MINRKKLFFVLLLLLVNVAGLAYLLPAHAADGMPKPKPMPQAPAPAIAPAPAPPPVQAAPAPTATSSATYAELDRLRTENVILSEKLKNAEVSNKLNGASAPVPLIQPSSFVGGSVKQSRRGERLPSYDRGARVVFVGSVGASANATVQLSDGSTVVVKPGQKVAGLGTIRAIKSNEVQTESGKEIFTIPFASESVSVSGQPMNLPNSVNVPPIELR